MPTLARMEADDCWARLRDEYTAVLAFCHEDDVHVMPVNMCIRGEQVWFRAAEGIKLRAARAGARMAVSVSRHDDLDHGGWSITARGPSEVMADGPPDDGSPRVRPWVLEARDGRWIRLAVDTITGRQLLPRGAVPGEST